MIKLWRRAQAAAHETLRFIAYTIRRFIADGCLMGAGALSYTTLVSLVPLVAIALSVFSAFPIFANARDQFTSLVFDSLVPQVGEEARWWFTYFASSAAHTTAFGVVALAVTAILMLATIEDQMNHIWRISSPRPWVQRILVYWTLLTLGPILVGASLSLSGYFDALAASAGIDAARIAQFKGAWFHSISNLVPFFLESIALALVYSLVPNTRVRWRNGITGAVAAAAAVELLKIAFAWYITSWASYRNVYGALAAIPIFLLWMYISWAAVLFGAVVAAGLPQWRVDDGEPKVPYAGRQLGLCLALLGEMARRSKRGGTLTTERLARRLGVAASVVDDHLSPLQRAGFVAATADGGWVLARSPDSATVFDLYKALELPFAGAWSEAEAKAPWQRRVAPAMKRIAAAESAAMRLPIALLIEELAPIPGEPVRLHRGG